MANTAWTGPAVTHRQGGTGGRNLTREAAQQIISNRPAGTRRGTSRAGGGGLLSFIPGTTGYWQNRQLGQPGAGHAGFEPYPWTDSFVGAVPAPAEPTAEAVPLNLWDTSSNMGVFPPGERVARLLQTPFGPAGEGGTFADYIGLPIDFATGGVRGSVNALFESMMPYYDNNPLLVIQALQQEFDRVNAPWLQQQNEQMAGFDAQSLVTNGPPFPINWTQQGPINTQTGQPLNTQQIAALLEAGYGPNQGPQGWMYGGGGMGPGQSTSGLPIPGISPENAALLAEAGVNVGALSSNWYGLPPSWGFS